MKNGVNSSESETSEWFFKKYDEKERKQFDHMVELFSSGQQGLVADLFSKLDEKEKLRFKSYRVDLKKKLGDETKQSQEKIEKLKLQYKELEATENKLTKEKNELFQNYAKNQANITHMTKNEPAITKPSSISSIFNKFKRF